MVGATVFLRTDKQMTQLSAQVAQAPAIFKQEETQRMNVVMKNFGGYKVIEIALILIGIGLIAFLQRSDIATGIGAGLVLQSAFMLALDTFAEVRGNEYVAALQAFGA